ncbi:Dihydrofolate reductase type 3 [compost metagenome]
MLTRSGQVPFEGMQAVASLDEAMRIAQDAAAPALCVIGGGEVYAQCLPLATQMHLTLVDTVVEDADAHFPVVDEVRWRVVARQRHEADVKHAHAFEFVDYVRVGDGSDVAGFPPSRE